VRAGRTVAATLAVLAVRAAEVLAMMKFLRARSK